MTASIDEFVELIRPTIEADLDQQIEAEQDPEARVMLRRNRPMLLGKALDATRIVNLQRKLAEAEARRLRLVPPGGFKDGRGRPTGTHPTPEGPSPAGDPDAVHCEDVLDDQA